MILVASGNGELWPEANWDTDERILAASGDQKQVIRSTLEANWKHPGSCHNSGQLPSGFQCASYLAKIDDFIDKSGW